MSPTPCPRDPAARRRRGPRVRFAVRGLIALVAVVAPAVVAIEAGAARPTATAYYVAIGASETLGYQGSGPGGLTVPTTQGYTNDVLSAERARWRGLHLVRFACPGIRMDMSLSGGRPTALPVPLQHISAPTTTGRCRRDVGSEVATASAFIRAHAGEVVLVTIDIGYPDVAACMAGEVIDHGCVSDALARIRAGLPIVVARLRAADGRRLRIVGLEHADPSLADYVGGPAGSADPQFAMASAQVTGWFNRVVSATYSSVGVRVARVGAAFGTADTSPADLRGKGTVPFDVKAICTLTWMCTSGNIHPNAEGYRRIADAIDAAVAGERR